MMFFFNHRVRVSGNDTVGYHSLDIWRLWFHMLNRGLARKPITLTAKALSIAYKVMVSEEGPCERDEYTGRRTI
jgi:hypothetical protein